LSVPFIGDEYKSSKWSISKKRKEIMKDIYENSEYVSWVYKNNKEDEYWRLKRRWV